MPLFSPLRNPTGLGFMSNIPTAVAAGDGKVMGQGPFGVKYYLQGALAGGICCSITHGALTPVDVVKTRIQLDPVKYNQGFIGGFKQVISAEGAGALLTGLGPTAQGYFIQVCEEHRDGRTDARTRTRRTHARRHALLARSRPADGALHEIDGGCLREPCSPPGGRGERGWSREKEREASPRSEGGRPGGETRHSAMVYSRHSA